ncbi:MAG: hypothetical protein KQJ78_20990 [Deltaproteobacteria bacterium]|nr:hypothetical protein [Deltaproteobacteria bacterium]
MPCNGLKKVMAWTTANNNKPSAGFFALAMEDGVLCGIAESGEEHGFEAAQLAAQILQGKKAGDFPVTTAKKGSIICNLKTAEKLGISIPYDLLQSADQVIK